MHKLAFERPVAEQINLKIQGNLLEFKVRSPIPVIPPPCKRGIISGFSPSARLRMFKFINRVNWNAALPGVFITLTYPDEFIGRPARQRNQDRYLFARWAESRAGKKIPYLWRCEWMPRKTGNHIGTFFAHLHLLYLGVRFLDKKEINAQWKKTIGAEGTVITWVDGILDGRKAGIYLAKYIAKKEDSVVLDIPAYLNKIGRNWGTVRKGMIPLHPLHEFNHLTKSQVDWLRAEGSSALPWLDENHQGSFTVMGAAPQRILEEMKELSLTGEDEGV